MGELNFTSPVDYPAGGEEGHKYRGRGGRHYGIDYPAPKGTSVIASESGLVLRDADNPKTPDRPMAGNVMAG